LKIEPAVQDREQSVLGAGVGWGIVGRRLPSRNKYAPRVLLEAREGWGEGKGLMMTLLGSALNSC